MYPCSLETVSGQFYHPRVSAVWPGPHALTTRVKRCEPANTGFRRCGPGHTNQGCLSSRVACVARIVCNRAAETVSGRFYPPKNRKCVAWATRIDKQPWFVWHWPHGFSAVWPVPHEPRLFVNPCGWRSTSSKFGGSPRRKVSILYPCSLETILDDFTLQKHVNVLPGPHGLTNSLKICEPGNTVVRRCCQVHVF